jgi:hypothetical protein
VGEETVAVADRCLEGDGAFAAGDARDRDPVLREVGEVGVGEVGGDVGGELGGGVVDLVEELFGDGGGRQAAA